jgi:hypothetical protein
MKGRQPSLAAPLALLVLFGCAERDTNSDASDAPSSNATSLDPVTDRWLGQWNGPEGTFLRLEGGKGRYEITIRDLDGARTYQGVTVGDQIHFDRNGATESIRASNGVETGMKWLSDKSDCLTIRAGEGYCRD